MCVWCLVLFLLIVILSIEWIVVVVCGDVMWWLWCVLIVCWLVLFFSSDIGCSVLLFV